MAQYVVIQNDHVQMVGHYQDTPKRGVLMRGKVGAIFGTREAAFRAIERTNEYAEAKELPWSRNYKIQPVAVGAASSPSRGTQRRKIPPRLKSTRSPFAGDR